jgi:hypothetical protein
MNRIKDKNGPRQQSLATIKWSCLEDFVKINRKNIYEV